MKYYPVPKGKGEVEVLGDSSSAISKEIPGKGSFISFRYSSSSVSYADGKTHIRSQKKSFMDGKFESEEFEGTLDGDVYTQAAEQMQKNIQKQIAAFFRPFSFFLPFFPDDRDK